MNFSMQITHLNQKWRPVLFVFRQLRHQENQKLLVFCAQFLQAHPVSETMCGPLDGRGQLSRQNNWGTVSDIRNSKLRQLDAVFGSKHFFPFSKSVWVYCGSKQHNLSWMQCFHPMFFSLSLCNGAHGLTGDWFLWAQHLYFLHLAVFSHSSCSLTTAPSCFLFLWGLTGQRASVPLEEKKKERRKGWARDLRLHRSATRRMKFMKFMILSSL